MLSGHFRSRLALQHFPTVSIHTSCQPRHSQLHVLCARINIYQIQADTFGHRFTDVGFMEGDSRKTGGARVLLALAGVLEALVSQLQRADSAIAPYTDMVLRCLVSLFLLEEGFLAVQVRGSIRREWSEGERERKRRGRFLGR